ncbi:CAF17-like 4Fe-4S cluster assembly/insertion protein YgfZ [Leucobacter sp. M11]|uniref:CAF17-like 4Fe-4S cluster assembly/insertion protein YgfZ n=1 Tax=Leucobacter sp. M11 TaxID=2993565 RepID=UPI002D7FBA40|nr:folate-binding protein [Leucobacter sp. M11]MEB4613967.1 folate-binding protein [Leucobacter sp. M11]
MSPLLGLPGAVAVEGRGVAAHYGSPLIEQRALAAGEAIIDRSDHGVITVAGPDRLSWLDSMTSQALTRLPPGGSAETLLLDPQGRIEFAIRVADDGETAWLLVDPGLAEGLAAFLNRMRFTLRVEVTDRSASHGILGAFAGGQAAELLAELPGVVATWNDPWAEVQRGGWLYAAAEGHPGNGWSYREVIVPRETLADARDLVAAKRVRVAGALSLDALQILAWRPSQAAEGDERSLPHEVDWLRSAVHLEKGCYRGQETVAKVHNLGHPPRRLVLLHLDGSSGELPAAGTLVYPVDGEKPVGRITRAALHHEWGPVALAMLKRNTAEDAPLEIRLEGADGATGETLAAAQETIVPRGAGATRDVPRLPRL